jgi:hypothetical protein
MIDKIERKGSVNFICGLLRRGGGCPRENPGAAVQ